MYKNRISDIELKRKLSASGAVLIRGGQRRVVKPIRQNNWLRVWFK
jgi:hypothetical protein